MALPASFARDGFVDKHHMRTRMKLKNGKLLKPLLIGTEGETNTGKSEFLLSCPDPGIIIVVDRNIDGALDNPHPPAARRSDFAFKVVQVPPNMTANQPIYLDYFLKTRQEFYKALDNLDAVTVAIDGDSDFWELQRLGAFGKLTQVFPQTKYTDVYAAKRAMITRAWDSGKIIIGTNKVRDEYESIIGPDGNPVMENGEEKKRKTGNKQRQGFPDTDFLWQIQIQHLCRPARINAITKKEMPMQWGLRILKCKAQPQLKDTELWGADCNFLGLVSLVYPDVSPQEWGF